MWSNIEFAEGLDGRNAQIRKSLTRAAGMLAEHAGSSFSRTLGNSFRQTVSRILSDEKMSQDQLLEGHRAATLQRCADAQPGRIVIAQDTVYFNYSGHKAMEGLGTIQGDLLGIVQHNALAMDQSGLPLGVLHLRSWTRGEEEKTEKESQKWFHCLREVSEQVKGLNRQVVLVQDREADIFDFFKEPRAGNLDLIVRLSQKRKYEDADSLAVWQLAQGREHLPILGTQEVNIRRENKDCKITLEIRSGRVNALPRKDLSARIHKTQGLSMVIATEIAATDSKGQDLFDPEKPAEWILLTSLDAEGLENAAEVVRLYAKRWGVERFHFTCKSGGLDVERLQLESFHATRNALALYAITAWRIMYLAQLVRQEPDQPPQPYFTSLEIKVLEKYHPEASKTLARAVTALGKLVGFVPTKKQPFPGIKIMAEALRKLNDITAFLQTWEGKTLQD